MEKTRGKWGIGGRRRRLGVKRQRRNENGATRANEDWPSGQAYEVMIQLVKEYKLDDTMAKMEMEKALDKLSLVKKRDPNDLNDELPAIECRYKLDLTELK